MNHEAILLSLEDIYDIADDHADIKDGPNGPVANAWMELSMQLKPIIHSLRKEWGFPFKEL